MHLVFFSAHATCYPRLFELILRFMACVLTTTIRMMEKSFPSSTSKISPRQSLFDQGYFHLFVDHSPNQMKIRRYCFRAFSSDGFVVSAPAHPHNITPLGSDISLLMRPGEVVSDIDSLAKKAAALFRISVFIFGGLFSWWSRMSSSFSGLIFSFPGKAGLPSAVSCFFHRLRIP